MKRLPSTSSMYAPDARRMKSGEAPTDLNARTGLSTPPGRMLSARVKRREDRVVFMREAFSRASMARAGEAVAANDDAGPLAGMTHVVENDLAVHDDRRDADRILERIGERRAVGDRGRIEDDEIGGESFLDRAAVGDVELLRGQAAHLVDGLFERDDALLADVLAEDARKRAGREQTVFPRRIRIVHFFADPRARRRILQPFDELRVAAFMRPRWDRLDQAGAARDVRILIRRDFQAALLRRFDDRDDFLHAAEVLRAGHLDVEHLHRNVRAFTDRDGLFQPFAQLVAVITQV